MTDKAQHDPRLFSQKLAKERSFTDNENNFLLTIKKNCQKFFMANAHQLTGFEWAPECFDRRLELWLQEKNGYQWVGETSFNRRRFVLFDPSGDSLGLMNFLLGSKIPTFEGKLGLLGQETLKNWMRHLLEGDKSAPAGIYQSYTPRGVKLGDLSMNTERPFSWSQIKLSTSNNHFVFYLGWSLIS